MDDDDDEEGDDDGGDARRGAWLMKRSDKTKTWNRRWVRVVNGRLEFRTRADEGGDAELELRARRRRRVRGVVVKHTR